MLKKERFEPARGESGSTRPGEGAQFRVNNENIRKRVTEGTTAIGTWPDGGAPLLLSWCWQSTG